MNSPGRFFVVHRQPHTSLATDRGWLSGADAGCCDDAVALLARLETLAATREAQLQSDRDAARVEGFEAGRREALAAVGPALIAAWDAAARSAVADAQGLRSALVDLSLKVVQHIADQLAPAQVAAALAVKASQTLLPDSAALVRVHPDVAAAVRERLNGAAGVLEVRADDTLSIHGCVFETPAGRLLASLPVQLERLTAELQAAHP